MKVNIERAGSSETWSKTEYHCLKLGSERVWVNEQQLGSREAHPEYMLALRFHVNDVVGWRDNCTRRRPVEPLVGVEARFQSASLSKPRPGVSTSHRNNHLRMLESRQIYLGRGRCTNPFAEAILPLDNTASVNARKSLCQ
jgi:hypothetical protein